MCIHFLHLLNSDSNQYTKHPGNFEKKTYLVTTLQAQADLIDELIDDGQEQEPLYHLPKQSYMTTAARSNFPTQSFLLDYF